MTKIELAHCFFILGIALSGKGTSLFGKPRVFCDPVSLAWVNIRPKQEGGLSTLKLF